MKIVKVFFHGGFVVYGIINACPVSLVPFLCFRLSHLYNWRDVLTLTAKSFMQYIMVTYSMGDFPTLLRIACCKQTSIIIPQIKLKKTHMESIHVCNLDVNYTILVIPMNTLLTSGIV